MKKENQFQTGKVAIIASGHFVHDVFSSFLAPILPLLIEKLSLSLSVAGLLSSIQRLPSLLNPFVGLIADKQSARFMLVAAPSITAVSMSLLGIAPNIGVLLLLLFSMGIGASLFHVPGPVIIRTVSGERVGKGMSFFMFGGEIARSFAPIVILTAVSVWGLEGTFRLIPIGLFASVLLYIYLKDVEIKSKKNEKKRGIRRTVKDILPLFINIIGITFFLTLMRVSLTAFLPTYITMKGESLWSGGIALSALQIAGAAGTFLSGTLSDKIGRKNMLLIVSIVSPFLIWLFLFAGDQFTVPILLILGLFAFGSTPVILAVVNETVSDRPSLINGIYITINFGIGGSAVLIAGIMGDLLGLETTYRITSLLSLGAIPFIFRLNKTLLEVKKKSL